MKCNLNFQTLLIFLLGIVYTKTTHAQFQGEVYQRNYFPSVLHATDTLENAWQGGMNSTHLQMADLNNDGQRDIVIYDYVNNQVFTYLHTNANGINSYTYNPQFESSFPIGYIHPIKGYLLLRDYNCDNIPDLFTKGQFGVSVSKGFYLGNQLKFTLYKNLFFPATFGPINVYVQPGDIPVIDDIDNDGDIDIMSFDVQGTVLNFYKNLRVEENLACDTMKMSLAVNCWGQFTQGFYRTAFLNATCKGFEPTGIVYPMEDTIVFENESIGNTSDGKPKAKRHVGNCLLTLDIDNDLDKDLIIGGTGFNDINLLTNGGTTSLANITSQDTTFNTAANNKVYLPSWVASSYEDVDADGKKDLVCGTHLEKNGPLDCENNKMLFFKNTGSNSLPNFQTPTQDLLFHNILDFGINSFPTFFDFDKDGKEDLFVGAESKLDTSNYKLAGRIAHYKNISTINNLAFELVSSDFLNISAKKYAGVNPHFTDVTGDGIADLIMGGNNGKIVLYKNMATSNTVSPNFVWITDSFINIDAGNYSAPSSADINKDGKKDLVIGNEFGKLIYYEDTSTVIGVKAYNNVSNNLGMVNAGGKANFLGYAAPTFTKVDNTRKEILLIGTGDGTIERYDSLYVPIYGPYVRTDSFYSLIQTQFRSVPAVSDINGDGFYDMVVGSKMGGLKMYTQVKLVDSTPIVIPNGTNYLARNNNMFSIYPNPATNIIQIQPLLTNYGAFTFVLMNMAGQIIREQKYASSNLQQFSIANLQNGLYSYKIITQKSVQAGTILKNE
jgi:hypothetical protein